MILVTGATSQVGILLVRNLALDGQKVRCFVRKTSNIDGLEQKGVEIFYGDIEDPESLRTAARGVDHIVHIAGIWRSNTLLEVCKEEAFAGRVIFVGSTSRFKKLDSIDPEEKRLAEKMCEAEAYIAGSELNYVILRPTMLYGLDRDKNILHIIKFMKRFRFYPQIGRGTAYKHPVYVGDVVDAIVSCLFSSKVVNKDYILAGAKPIRYKDMLNVIRRNLPFRAFIFRVPVFAAYTAVFIYKIFKPSSYINFAMVKRVNEDIIYDIGQANKDFGYSPVDFEAGVREQINYLVGKKLL